jgi:two-component system response regulator NreC
MYYIWQRIRSMFEREETTRLTFELDQEALQTLQYLAQEETRSERELAADLLAESLARLQSDEIQWQNWQRLTPRQQEVAALICLGYTNKQIAARLTISPETVKTHVRNVLYKFNLRRKTDLQQVLSGWDFSAWEA